MVSFNSIISNIYKKYYKHFKNKKNLKQLGNIQNRPLKSFYNAINSVLKNQLTPEELNWVKKIKTIRDGLRSSNIEVKFDDLGAGTHINSIAFEKNGDIQIVKKTLGQVCAATILFRWGNLLFKLIREFTPSKCLELGTCIGISSAYQAAGLELNNQGQIFTIEGARSLVKIAIENFKKLDLQRVSVKVGVFNDVLPDLLPQIKPIDFAFIDGHHNGQATINYFEQIFPFLSKNAILFFDDIGWSKGMQRAWRVFEKDERIKFTIDLWSMGVCIITNSSHKKQKFKVFFE